MITIKSEQNNFGINFPTSIEELTPEILTTITDNVSLSKYYCVVALCFKTKLFDFVAMIKNQNNTNIGVVPILAKINDDDKNISIGDRIIIDRSSLERGIHINIPVSINSSVARNYFNSDSNLVKQIMTKNYNTNGEENIIVVEFKIIPTCDIVASYPITSNNIDPFVVNNNKLN